MMLAGVSTLFDGSPWPKPPGSDDVTDAVVGTLTAIGHYAQVIFRTESAGARAETRPCARPRPGHSSKSTWSHRIQQVSDTGSLD